MDRAIVNSIYQSRLFTALFSMTILLAAFPSLWTNWLKSVNPEQTTFRHASLWRACFNEFSTPIGPANIYLLHPRVRCCSLFHSKQNVTCNYLWHYLDKKTYHSVSLLYLTGFFTLGIATLLLLTLRNLSLTAIGEALARYVHSLLIIISTACFTVVILLFNEINFDSNGVTKMKEARHWVGFHLALWPVMMLWVSTIYYAIMHIALVSRHRLCESLSTNWSMESMWAWDWMNRFAVGNQRLPGAPPSYEESTKDDARHSEEMEMDDLNRDDGPSYEIVEEEEERARN